jgi:hypothetical protein
VPTILRVTLQGPDARLGAVAATDVARMLLGIQRVVARASGHVVGRRVRPTGRWGVLIENAVRFQLLRLEEGSLVTVLQLPDIAPSEDTFGLEVETLGELALARALNVAAGDSAEPDIAEAFTDWADELGIGARYTAVNLESSNGASPRRVVVDPPAVERLRGVAARRVTAPREDTLTGLLFEADFERDTAHLRAPDGASVAVRFGAELSDEIHRALRQRTSLVGEVHYDPVTNHAISIRLREISRPAQLRIDLAPETFFENPTIDDLRNPQRRPAGDDLSRVQDVEAEPGDVDAFLAALADL